MSESNATTAKGKNKKKKSKTPKKIEETPTVLTESNCPIQLPQHINECTFINDVRVTLMETKPAQPPPPVEKTGKKNKKKSKGQQKDQKPKEEKPVVEEKIYHLKNTMAPTRMDHPPLVTNISKEESIALQYLPEITVTPLVEQKVIATANVAEESVGNDTSEDAASKKKKKKKKKKKNNEEKVVDEKENVTNTEKSEAAIPKPTYVKLPSTGDTTVLVVSHLTNDAPKSTSNQASNIASIVSADIISAPVSLHNSFYQPMENTDPSILAAARSSVSITPIENSQQMNDTGNTAHLKNEEMVKIKTAKNVPNQKKPKNEKQVPQEVQKVLKHLKIPVEMSKDKEVKGKQPTAVKSVVKVKKATHASLFAHLPQYKSLSAVTKYLESRSDIHPAVLAVGAQCAEGIISGSNARCVALLAALKQVVSDYKTPPNKELSRDLDAKFQECINFIGKCRPLAVSMTNAVRVIKYHVNNIQSNISDDEAKKILNNQIDNFIKEEIYLAQKAIADNTINKITDGDVILTYAYSSVVKQALCEAHKQNKSFRVIVVDSRPKMEAKHMLKCLLDVGINCSYMLINGISYTMREVTKVIIGAHALQANGYVMSRVGSSQIALSASFYNVPFLVCCETYKFCERVHTDSFVYNELGDPESFLDVSETCYDGLNNWKDIDNLHLLNPLYDIMPPHLVSMVITEKGMLPCTSVPVVLRVRHSGTHEQ